MRYFALLILFAFYALLPFKTHAQNEGGVTVNPAYIDVEMVEEDEEVEFQIEYTNNSDKPIELEIFPIDFRQTDERGVIGFLGEESKNYDYSLSSFLTFEVNSLQLAPGETKKLVANINNRLDLSPGGHYAAVVARLVTGAHDRGNTNIAPAASTLVYLVKKGGERYNLSIVKSDWPAFPMVFGFPSTLILTFQNEGNVHLSPFGTISVRDMFSREIFSGSLNNASFKVMPSSRRIVPGYLTNMGLVAPISFVTMEIKGSDFGKNANFLHRESFFYINPLTIIVPVLIVGFVMWRKKRKR